MVLTPCGQGGFDNDIIKNGLRKNQAGMEGGGGRPQAQMRSIPDPLAMPSLLLIAHYAYAPPPHTHRQEWDCEAFKECHHVHVTYGHTDSSLYY